ncbi:MAG: tripartite tricarboxylate transporter substrate binding protein [Burkholderiaceae bacterium]|nr:tripartite tricarboxylate transporter substrate binding protein [Burkholderiaceae bacterium]
MRRQVLKQLAGAAALLLGTTLAASVATAQDFPKKQPIKLVVPYPAGGGTDVLARITAEYLQRRLGQTVIVENKAGGTGTIGAAYVANAPADGYTLLFAPASDFTVNPVVRKSLPYKVEDFSFLVRSWTSVPLLIASPKFPVSTIQELVAHMKANPGKVTQGTAGIGNIVHLGMARFDGAVGVSGLVVPYQGIAPVYQGMLEGSVQISQSTPGFPDSLKVLAAVGTKRSPFYPNAPTLEEVGIKNASWDGWFGVVAPPNLPKPIAELLTSEIIAVLKTPEAITKYEAAKLPPDEPLVGDAFKKRVLEEQQMWKTVVERNKIVVE